ncbi:MAG: hypothetical protein KXJ53_07520, partial [Phenylobacterium sp.]|nr:hypothetical protein [Phenylobacterium sp.]
MNDQTAKPSGADAFRDDAERVARDERDIQKTIDRQDARASDGDGDGDEPKAMQAGARAYPAPPRPP